KGVLARSFRVVKSSDRLLSGVGPRVAAHGESLGHEMAVTDRRRVSDVIVDPEHTVLAALPQRVHLVQRRGLRCEEPVLSVGASVGAELTAIAGLACGLLPDDVCAHVTHERGKIWRCLIRW